MNNNPYPEELNKTNITPKNSNIKNIIMFAHKDSHYIFLHFNIGKKLITATVGLNNDTKKWLAYAMSCL